MGVKIEFFKTGAYPWHYPKDVPKNEAIEFTLRYLSNEEREAIFDTMITIPGGDVSAEREFSFQMNTLKRANDLLRKCVVGWKNFKVSDDNELPFELKTLLNIRKFCWEKDGVTKDYDLRGDLLTEISAANDLGAEEAGE